MGLISKTVLKKYHFENKVTERAFDFFLRDFLAVNAHYDGIIMRHDRGRIFHTRITQGIVSRRAPWAAFGRSIFARRAARKK